MTSLLHALQAGGTAGHRPPRPAIGATSTIAVAGGAGALGSAVLERLLASDRLGPVRVLVSRGFTVGLRGLEPVQVNADELSAAPIAATGRAPGPTGAAAPIAATALILFDRPRHANGRERAFIHPRPAELPALARWFRERGVERLVVVLPHAPASLPDALKHGLANLDEQAVVALGFRQLVFVRSAEAPVDARAGRWLQRVADGVLAQLRIMISASQQPVRAPQLAAFVVELLGRLPEASGATRIVPPELVWQAAQLDDPAPLVAAWLDRRELPPLPRRSRVRGAGR